MKILLLILSLKCVVFASDHGILQEFAAENIQYIGNLYKELLNVHKGNFLVCPLSIQSVFALVNSGARGNTAKQITTTLHLPEGEDNVRKTFIGLTKALQPNDQYTLTTANKIYVEEHFNISDGYKNVAVEVFHSEIENIRFTEGTAADQINGWVEEKTHNKVKNLVSPQDVGPGTVAVFINALYFQGTWVTQFEGTKKSHFKLNSKDSVLTTMMYVSDMFGYYDNTDLGAELLVLPYKGEEVTMTIVLPKEIEGLSTIESSIHKVLAEPQYFNNELVHVTIPKFKLETTSHLIPILKSMGITDAFSGSADFSGIGANNEHLYITEVVQKAYIEVDEKGTTAGAATAIVMGRSGRKYRELNFVADRPFLFFLRHRVNGVFFIGRYSVAAPVE